VVKYFFNVTLGLIDLMVFAAQALIVGRHTGKNTLPLSAICYFFSPTSTPII
jgi:hypothetical protein